MGGDPEGGVNPINEQNNEAKNAARDGLPITSKRTRRAPVHLNDYVCANDKCVKMCHTTNNNLYSVTESGIRRTMNTGTGSTRDLGPPAICSPCQMSFSSRKNLVDHLRLATLERKHDEFFSDGRDRDQLLWNHEIDWDDLRRQELTAQTNCTRTLVPRGRGR